ARRGQRDEALAGLREASSRLLQGQVLPFAALALVDQAELAAGEAGDPEAAREAAAHLEEIADRTGRDLYRGFAAFGRACAELAARGHTARQIAEALFVGERTVEGHLASVYAKLGISSKVDLARRADALGL